MKKFFKTFMLLYQDNKIGTSLLVFLCVLSGLLNLLGLGLLASLFTSDGSENFISKASSSFFRFLDTVPSQENVAFLIVIVFLARLVVAFVYNKRIAYQGTLLVSSKRKEIVHKVLHTPFLKLQDVNTGEVVNSLVKETERLYEAYLYTCNIILQLMLALIFMILGSAVSSESLLALLFLGGGLAYLIKKISSSIGEKSEKSLMINEKITQFIGEMMASIKYLKATNRNKGVLLKFSRLVEEYLKEKNSLEFIIRLSKDLPEILGGIIIAILILINTKYWNIDNSLIILSAAFFYKCFRSVSQVQFQLNKLSAVYPSVEKLESLFGPMQEEELSSETTFQGFSNISLSNFDFSYNDTQILKGINLNIQKNEFVGILGESGSGKTTLINIISGIYGRHEKFTVNDDSLFDLKGFREKIGYVSQEPLIFEATLRDNITLWTNSYSDLEIKEVLKRCALFAFEDKLNLKLKDRGGNLSGGQKQRINIARELVKNPDILFLDEPTSALDKKSEREILETLKLLKGSITIILVTHNRNLLEVADRVLEIEKGSIFAVS